MSRVKIVAGACIAVFMASGLLLARGTKPTGKPVDIEIPGTRPDVVSLQTAGAWPLTIRMVADAPLGIGTYITPYEFPIGSQQAFIVFSDPDGCFSLGLAHDPNHDPCPGGTDETYVEFTPAINLPDLVKYHVDRVSA